MKYPLVSYKCTLIALLLLVILPAFGFAQKKDNLGKEFYIAFAENQGGQIGSEETENFMALYITSKVATSGTVEVTALSFSKNFTTTPGTITTIELPDGQQFGAQSVEITTDEQVVQGMAVHVTSNDEIAVYGINSKLFSTDAWMALPVDVLGTEYRTMNYRTSTRGDTPGQFWIVGTQDSTNVTITPKATTANGTPAGTPIKTLLYKGDVFLVQGYVGFNDPDHLNDLTGSLIESDQPIAVLSGHVRTEIPYNAKNQDNGQPSRNHLVEQLPPVSAWGDSALVIPYSSASLPDLVRIVSSEDGNKITVNGTLVKTLNAGDFYEITTLQGPTSIQGTNPILVGQFLHTSQFGTTGNRSYGDPAYALVFPVEQFDQSYTFIEAERDLFHRNFVNVVADPAGIATLTITGPTGSGVSGLVSSIATFKTIPGSNYQYAQVELPQNAKGQGSYTMSGTKPFGITVYALGPADAYSYTGGSLLKTITPFKTVNVVIDFGDRVLTPPTPPAIKYNTDPTKNFWDTTVYLQNISSDPYKINSFATQGGNGGTEFSVPGVYPKNIGPSAFDSITIRFSPELADLRYHTKLQAQTEHLQAYVVDVYGRGILENAQVFSDSTLTMHVDTLDFGVLDASTDPPKDSFMYVFNKGPVPLAIKGYTITPSTPLTMPTDFDIQSTMLPAGNVTPPYTLPGFNNLLNINQDTAAKVIVRFNTTPGMPNGQRVAELDILNAGIPQKVILLAQVRTILKSTVLNASFDTAYICQEQGRSVFVDNPNDFAISVDSVTLGGLNPTDFNLITGMPLVIPPSSRGEIQLRYSPNAVGGSSATAIVNFDLPKGFADTLKFAAYGDQLTSKFWARNNIHILPDEETLFPIYARSPMQNLGSSSFVLTISYDPTYLEDYDYVQDNTLTATGAYTVNYDTAGFRQLFYQTLDGSVITGGSDTEAMPLVYIKFRSHLNGGDKATFHQDIDINYNVAFDKAIVQSGCIASLAPVGRISLDSSCQIVSLLHDTLLYPQESFIEPVRPNPVTTGRAKFVFDVPKEDIVTLDLVDALGNKAATIMSETKKPGTYEVQWYAGNVKEGMYYVRLTTAGQTKLRKMVVVK